ncbi:cytochrome P450 [Novosphingobium indicum]|nr:cytochrome P450 [Novosphingobium indicum]
MAKSAGESGAEREIDGDTVPVGAAFTDNREVRRCPFDLWERIREQPGLYYHEPIEAWIAARHADVMQVVRDPVLFSSKLPFGKVAARKDREVLEPLLENDPEVAQLIKGLKPRRTPVLVNCDPPNHARQRRLVQGSFVGKRINDAEPMVENLARELIDGFPADGKLDLVSAFAVPLPVHVIARLLGADDEQQQHFKRWSDDFMRTAGNVELSHEVVVASMRGNLELYDYLRKQIADRRTNPRDDLLTSIIEARQPGDEPFSEDELLAMFSQFVVAGNETTTALIGSSLLTLAREPHFIDELYEDESKIARFIDEILRREAPVQSSFRIATQDTEVAGQPIKAGEQILLMYGAANRDESVYGDPAIDLDAKRPNHLAFGFGEHFCLGSNLAKMEAKIALKVFLDTFVRFPLQPDAVIDYAGTYQVRSLLGLPVTLQPRGAA